MPLQSQAMTTIARGAARGSLRSPTKTAQGSILVGAVATARTYATVSPSAPITTPPVASTTRDHRIVVIGGGTAGLCATHQLLRTDKFKKNDLAIIEPAEWHHYQPGWTLVGGGLRKKEDLRKPMASLIDSRIKRYDQRVAKLDPAENTVQLGNGDRVSYEHLIVAPGIKIDYGSIKGLEQALADPNLMVSTIYGYETCSKVYDTIERMTKGTAIFTQPTGIIKCAGAPQKAMWLALDRWRRKGLYNPADPSSGKIEKIVFATGLPGMFGVAKYSAALEELRKERGVEGLFQHDLVAIEGDVARFSRPRADGKPGAETVERRFDFLHATPKMGPHAFVRESPVANEAGYVDVDQFTMRSTRFPNVWSIGDASSLPTSKTAAAITAQSPVLVRNMLRTIDGKEGLAADFEKYDGYTSCPLLTEYGKVLLAEFKYGGEPSETFGGNGGWLGIDQAKPRRAFYFLKKDFFPWVYEKFMVKGTWGGARGWINKVN